MTMKTAVLRAPESKEKRLRDGDSVSQEIYDFLEGKGYTLFKKIGEGNTRDVYEVTYNNGPLQKTRICKIPKEHINPNSITTLINLSKRNVNEREVVALNKISNPHIIEVYDAFNFGGKTITIEENYDSASLEDLVKMSGPISDSKRFRQIFSQMADGLQYLHEHERLLHRDIKPSNLLVGREGSFVKICDLQNAGRIDDIVDSMLPTKGGTSYTALSMLKNFMSGKETKASLSTEFYSLGATMFYALTGKNIFDFALVGGKNGRQIEIDGKKIGVALLENGKSLQDIDIEKYEKLIKEKLKQAPKQYRNLLANCLISGKDSYCQESWTAHSKLKQEIEKATAPLKMTYLKKAGKLAGVAAFIGLGLAGIIAGAKCNEIQERNAKKVEPTVFQMLDSKNFYDGKLNFIVDSANAMAANSLKSYFSEIKDSYPDVEKQNKNLVGEGFNTVDLAHQIHGISNRMMYSLVRSILMEDKSAAKSEYGTQRLENFLVPTLFAIKAQTNDFGRANIDAITQLEELALATMYIKQCIGNNTSIADIFTEYFSNSNEEIFTARQKSGSISYFPTISERGTVHAGYRENLPYVQRQLIDRALAFYYITDEEGKLHLDIINNVITPQPARSSQAATQ